MKKNIAVVAGGNSGEHDISIKSGQNIADNLDKQLFNVFFIHLRQKEWTYTDSDGNVYSIDKNDFTLWIEEKHICFDCVFIAIHGTPGEDGKLQGYLDILQIPYTGCNMMISALTFNKYLCNKVVASFGVKVAESVHLFKNEKIDIDVIAEKLGFPCFVKPCCSGSSVGMSKVEKKEELSDAIKNAFTHDEEVLVEKFISGREITCGVMKWNGKIHVLEVTEIISKRAFFDLEAKYDPSLADEITPALIENPIRNKCEKISKLVYQSLGCEGIVRIDYIFNEEDIYFIEINTIPGQTNESIIPKQVRYLGLNFTDLCTYFIEDAIKGK